MKATRALAIVLLSTLSAIRPAHAADEGKIGKMTVEDFTKATKTGVEQIKAVKPSGDPLSEADQKFLTDIALAGMVQVQAAKTALEKSESADVKTIATADEETQTALEQKLRELAGAKGLELPEKPGAKAEKDLAGLREKTGKGFDAAYLVYFAAQGNEQLWTLMTKIEKNAKDSSLKEVVKVALPLIRMHTKTAKAESEDDD